MPNSHQWMFFSIILLFIISGCAEEKHVFVVSDIYGVRPDGTAQEIDDGEFRHLVEQNIHWDSANQRIKMHGAQNEEVAVQIIIPGAYANVTASSSALTGPMNIATSQVRFSLVGWVAHTDLGLVPDLIIPLDGTFKQVTDFSIPINIEGLPAAENQVGVLLYEVWIPKDAEPGSYTGKIILKSGDEIIDELQVDLTVFDFQLPDQPSMAFELLSYGMPSKYFMRNETINRKPGLGHAAHQPSREALSINQQVFKLAMDNRCFVNPLPYASQRGWGNNALPINGKGAAATISSYKEWESLYGPLLNGDLSKFGVAPAHLLLPFNINYPYLSESEPGLQFDFTPFRDAPPAGPGEQAALAEFEETFSTIAAQYIAYFSAKGWDETLFEVFFNQKPNPDRNRTPWKLDEPTEKHDYAALRYLFSVSDQAFREAATAGIQIRNRIDIGHFNCDRFQTPDGEPTHCYKKKGYNRDNADNYLKPHIQHWVIGTTHVEGAADILNQYRQSAVKLINYSTSGTSEAIGGHFGMFAGEGFRAFHLGLSGRVIFKLGLGNTNPNKIEAGPYQGGALYTGREIGYQGVLASHRIKLWRRSVNDYDYLLQAQKTDPGRTDSILAEMIRSGPSANTKYRAKSNSKGIWFNNNVEDAQCARLLLAEIITGKDYGAGSISGFSDWFAPCGAADQIVGYD